MDQDLDKVGQDIVQSKSMSQEKFDFALWDQELDKIGQDAFPNEHKGRNMKSSFKDSNTMESQDSNSMESQPLLPVEHLPMDSDMQEKYCGVCGDQARSYNFGAISCWNCNAFFRTNAPKGLDYFTCLYEEKCKINVTRRPCKRCRLRKCFEIGMHKEYIRTEEELMRRRMLNQQNRSMKQYPTSVDKDSDVASCQVRLRPLEQEEIEAITEVVGAYRQSLEICVESEISKEQLSMVDVVNIAEICVRRLIDMLNTIKSFKALSQADQIALLKGGIVELLIIRSVITFDKDKQQFLDPCDTDKCAITTEQLKMAMDSAPVPETGNPGVGSLGEMGGMGLFEDHMKFVNSLALHLQADEKVLVLLLVMALYSPDRPDIQDKAHVAQEQERYALLLLRYLQFKHAPHVARLMYPKLLMKLVDIRSLSEEHSQVLLGIDPGGLQPLMKEVLEYNLDKKRLDGASSPYADRDEIPEGCGSPSSASAPVTVSGASAAAAAALSGERSPPLAAGAHPLLPPAP